MSLPWEAGPLKPNGRQLPRSGCRDIVFLLIMNKLFDTPHPIPYYLIFKIVKADKYSRLPFCKLSSEFSDPEYLSEPTEQFLPSTSSFT